MKKQFLLLLAIASIFYSVSNADYLPLLSQKLKSFIQNSTEHRAAMKPLNEINDTLQKEITATNPELINKAMTALKCANEKGVDHNNILTLIDYSRPSSEKRLWIFDLENNKLLFNTYVTHGIKTGGLLSTYFSNGMSSKASSIGVYNTEKTYNGRYGLSLKLLGLDPSFNDHAYARFIVMHGAWYANENFIKKYGRPGRSWGCPAIPLDLIEPVINTIKNNTLFVAYYPNPHWFAKSKFLNCDNPSVLNQNLSSANTLAMNDQNEERGEIYYVDLNGDNKREERDPVVVMAAEKYHQVFNRTVPVSRMLRRQINNTEYIALNNDEIQILDSNHDGSINQQDPENFNSLDFAIAQVRMERGYYATEIHFLKLGKIKEIKLNPNTTSDNFSIIFENRHPVTVKSTNQFIRWVGL